MFAGPSFAAQDYLVPAGCPEEPAFWSAVRERSLSIRSSTVALDVAVVITATTAGELTGEVSVHGGAPRRLTAHACDDLTRALALVTALLIDAEPPVEASREPRSAMRPRLEAPADVRERSSDLSIGFGVGTTIGALPGRAIGFPIFLDGGAVGGPRYRLGALFAVRSAKLGVLDGPIQYVLASLHVEVCPWQIALGPLVASPCAAGDAGLLFADARRSGLVGATLTQYGWLAAGVAGHLRYEFFGDMFLEASAGATVPFLRNRFLFGPGEGEIYSTPPVTGDFSMAAGITIW